jgi:hypothetical protein
VYNVFSYFKREADVICIISLSAPTAFVRVGHFSAVKPVEVGGNEPFFMLNNKTIYSSIIFANRIKSTTFIKFLKRVNEM